MFEFFDSILGMIASHELHISLFMSTLAITIGFNAIILSIGKMIRQNRELKELRTILFDRIASNEESDDQEKNKGNYRSLYCIKDSDMIAIQTLIKTITLSNLSQADKIAIAQDLQKIINKYAASK